jgi:hypothetical protein
MCHAWDLIYGTRPVEFPSAYGIDESVPRLKAVSDRPVFSDLGSQRAVGTVKATRVSLRRVIPAWPNAFKPHFIGKFHQYDGKVVLKGRFTMILPIKLFLSLWFGSALLLIAQLVIDVVTEGTINAQRGLLNSIVIICGGVAIVWAGKRVSRNDPDWLAYVIKQALS